MFSNWNRAKIRMLSKNNSVLHSKHFWSRKCITIWMCPLCKFEHFIGIYIAPSHNMHTQFADHLSHRRKPLCIPRWLQLQNMRQSQPNSSKSEIYWPVLICMCRKIQWNLRESLTSNSQMIDRSDSRFILLYTDTVGTWPLNCSICKAMFSMKWN